MKCQKILLLVIMSMMTACVSQTKQAKEEPIFQKYFDENGTERSPAAVHCQSLFSDQKQIKKTRVRKYQNTDPAYHREKMVFHDIEPGKFKMGEEKIETEITKSFSMQSTELTELQYTVVDVLYAKLSKGKIEQIPFQNNSKDQRIIDIDGVNVFIRPYHPARLDFNRAIKFIFELNILSSSSHNDVQKILAELIPGHEKGHRYAMPTEAEWEFVMTDRGNKKSKYFDRDDPLEMSQYAWLREKGSSMSGDHQVATKLPRVIDGKPFYDLEGNVGEWVIDQYAENGTLPGGIDPQFTDFTQDLRRRTYVTRGGSHSHFHEEVVSTFRQPRQNDVLMGLRVVRRVLEE